LAQGPWLTGYLGSYRTIAKRTLDRGLPESLVPQPSHRVGTPVQEFAPQFGAERLESRRRENSTVTREYYDSDKRYTANAVQVFLYDGSSSLPVRVDYPLGHRKRRAEGMPVLVKEFETSVGAHRILQ
jgi:hypothetical protein